MSARRNAIRRSVENALAGRVPAAFAPAAQLVPQLVPSGIVALDDPALLGGLPRGCLTEICGPVSSGRTTMLLAALAAATARQEAGCLIDVTDAFDPLSGAAAGIDFRRLLWVRISNRSTGASDQRVIGDQKKDCDQPWRNFRDRWPTADGAMRSQRRQDFARLEQALKVADIILQGGGFGLVAMDLADIAAAQARRVPLASWFRFRRAVERTPTVLLLAGMEPSAGTCASAVVKLSASDHDASQEAALPSHTRLLEKIEICAEALRVPGRKQPSQSVAKFVAIRAG